MVLIQEIFSLEGALQLLSTYFASPKKVVDAVQGAACMPRPPFWELLFQKKRVPRP